MLDQFLKSNTPGNSHPECSELDKVISGWESVVAVSLNVGRGALLVKLAKLYMSMQDTTHYEVMYPLRFRIKGLWACNKCTTEETTPNIYILGVFTEDPNSVVNIETRCSLHSNNKTESHDVITSKLIMALFNLIGRRRRYYVIDVIDAVPLKAEKCVRVFSCFNLVLIQTDLSNPTTSLTEEIFGLDR